MTGWTIGIAIVLAMGLLGHDVLMATGSEAGPHAVAHAHQPDGHAAHPEESVEGAAPRHLDGCGVGFAGTPAGKSPLPASMPHAVLDRAIDPGPTRVRGWQPPTFSARVRRAMVQEYLI